MKDVFGREWELVRLPDKKWRDMSNWEKFRDMMIGLLTIIALIFVMGWIGKV